MNLIFIYGPPASGKLTVAKELAKITGYKVFNNHTFVGCIADIFPYAAKEHDESRTRLTRDLRLKIFEEAAKANVDVVTTFGMSGPKYFNYFDEIKSTVESQGGKVLFIQLIASKEELMKRVEQESRKGTKIDSTEFLSKLLTDKPEIFEKYPGADYPSIDNTNLLPAEVAGTIKEFINENN
jgi:shikimate kinase